MNECVVLEYRKSSDVVVIHVIKMIQWTCNNIDSIKQYANHPTGIVETHNQCLIIPVNEQSLSSALVKPGGWIWILTNPIGNNFRHERELPEGCGAVDLITGNPLTDRQKMSLL